MVPVRSMISDPTPLILPLLYLGLVSRELAPFCKHIVGVDISQSMVDLYNKRDEHKNMSAVCAELKGEPGELGDEKFDIIIVC